MAVTKLMKFRKDEFAAKHVDVRRRQADQNAGGCCSIFCLTMLLILVVKPELFGRWYGQFWAFVAAYTAGKDEL
eukprot:SAG22_NODE_344_length_11914_cov_6.665679_10_plen_74_part_00